MPLYQNREKITRYQSGSPYIIYMLTVLPIVVPGVIVPFPTFSTDMKLYRIPLYEKLGFKEVLETLPEEWNICFVESTCENSPKNHSNSIPYYEADFTQPTVMVFGKEAGGLSPMIRQQAVEHGVHNIINTYIPTIPQLDSLNVSMAATVLIYEMVGVRFCGNAIVVQF